MAEFDVPGMGQEDDVTLPRGALKGSSVPLEWGDSKKKNCCQMRPKGQEHTAAVNKLIKEMIPNVRVSNDARELILNCCTEFIHLVSSEANEVCKQRAKKTIAPEHIIDALKSLGFTQYVQDVQSVYTDYKKQATSKRRGSNRLENLGIPEEELLRQQQALFAQARMEQAQVEQEQFLQAQMAQASNSTNSLPTPVVTACVTNSNQQRTSEG